MSARFVDFLAASLELLECECPQAYAAMCGALADRTLRLEVDGEPVSVVFTSRRAAIVAALGRFSVEVRTSRQTILDLTDAKKPLLDAVLDESLELRGDASELLAFLDGLRAYLHGAVRAPSFAPLLRRFRLALAPRAARAV
jgi:hypothetical protein